MGSAKRTHPASFKAKVALEAIKEGKTINEIASQHGVHPSQVCDWKKEALTNVQAGFSDKHRREKKEQAAFIEELYNQIGRLKVELDWLKKNLAVLNERRSWIERDHPQISLVRQCELLDLNRSSLYYKPVEIDEETLLLMRLLDEQYTRTPFYGVLRMQACLRRMGYVVNEKRVRRLLRLMGLEAIYQKPKLSQVHPEHRVYPYLLRQVEIVRRNQVWSTDITYIRLLKGFVYLVAVIDWFSRYVLSWRLSTTLETAFCIEALEEALKHGTPEIFNTDQGAQFTDKDFIGVLQRQKIAISMDGRGRWIDNIFVERLWRTTKYEEVYLHDYRSVADARQGLGSYYLFYNTERLHQALDYRTPKEVYFR